jgi:hypothetical protein
MSHARYKPTFLLRCVVLIFVLGAGFGAFALASAAGGGLLQRFTLAFGAALVLCSDLLSAGIVAVMTRHTEHRKEQYSPFWFVDLEQTKRLDAESIREDTKDNPTLR